MTHYKLLAVLLCTKNVSTHPLNHHHHQEQTTVMANSALKFQPPTFLASRMVYTLARGLLVASNGSSCLSRREVLCGVTPYRSDGRFQQLIDVVDITLANNLVTESVTNCLTDTRNQINIFYYRICIQSVFPLFQFPYSFSIIMYSIFIQECWKPELWIHIHIC